MRAAKRLGVLAAAAGAALALAGTALGAYAPRFLVTTSGLTGDDTPVTMTLTQSAGDRATARVRIATPASYAATTGGSPGTALGTAKATGPGALSGTITADDPADYAANTCLPGIHEGVWLLELSGGGQTIRIPLFVDSGGSSSLTIESCLPSEAELGGKLATLTLEFAAGIWKNPAARGEFVWRALLTPSGAAGPADPAAAVEARALVRQPALLTLSGKLGKKGKIVLFGRLLAGGNAVARVAVRLLAGRSPGSLKPVSSTRTTASGGYAFSLRLRRTTYFRTSVDVPAQDVTRTGCKAPSSAPAGCVTATLQPFHVLSFTSLKVTIRKR